MADYPYNTKRWQTLRLAHLAIEPACRGCAAMGRLTRANTVDHVHAIRDGGHPFPGHDGLASYCPSCHNAKTARGAEAGAIRTSKPRRGCDADGNPLDPAHTWHTGAKGEPMALGCPNRCKGAERGSQSILEAYNADKSLKANASRPTPNRRIELVSNRNLKDEQNGC